jgi:hypothetical protein
MSENTQPETRVSDLSEVESDHVNEVTENNEEGNAYKSFTCILPFRSNY